VRRAAIRSAVAALIDGSDDLHSRAEVERVSRDDPLAFVTALCADQVQVLFLQATRRPSVTLGLDREAMLALVREEWLSAKLSLRLSSASRALGEALEHASVEYVAFKGEALKRQCYERLHDRPALDADFLVAESAMPKVREVLGGIGATRRPSTGSSSHEEGYVLGDAHLDIHWNLLRPGRARFDPVPEILSRRMWACDLWVPCDEHNAAILLIHPAITDYVSARLVKAIDLARFASKRAPDWTATLDFLYRLGLRNAAWAMLVWTESLLRRSLVRPGFAADLAPSDLRQAYLRAWLHCEPDRVYAAMPALSRLGFSLALQDRMEDVIRAAWAAWRLQK
jgi:hypothetical protein